MTSWMVGRSAGDGTADIFSAWPRPGLRNLKGRHHPQQWAAVLDGNDTPRAEGPSVAQALDPIVDRRVVVAGVETKRLHRVGRANRIDGLPRGSECLAEQLAAVDLVQGRRERLMAQKHVVVEAFEVQDANYVNAGRHIAPSRRMVELAKAIVYCTCFIYYA